MIGEATFGSDNGGGEASAYRYSLTRQLASGVGATLFIGLNPSTATADKNDPTIRREIGFTERWGFGRLLKGNLFAFRATQPLDMKAAIDPIGPLNDQVLLDLACQADMIVCCWGADGQFLRRQSAVRKLLHDFRLHHLGLTKFGEPRHPLYLRGDTKPVPWFGGVNERYASRLVP